MTGLIRERYLALIGCYRGKTSDGPDSRTIYLQ